jgi:hypothetical protein
VEQDLMVSRVAVVAMDMPILRGQIDLDISDLGRVPSDLENCVSEIGAGFVVPEARVKNPQRAPVQQLHLVPGEPLMLPDLLQ